MRWPEIFYWTALAVVGALLVAAVYPRAFPLLPRGSDVLSDRAIDEAVRILDRLGVEVDRSDLRAHVDVHSRLDRYLALRSGDDDARTAPRLRHRAVSWIVSEGAPPGAGPPDGRAENHWVRIGFDGSAVEFELVREGPVDPLPDEEEAVERARALLRDLGFDTSRLDKPTFDRREGIGRPELEVSFPWRQEEKPTFHGGLSVHFQGDRIGALRFLLPPPGENPADQATFLAALRWLATLFLGLYLAVRYLRYYDSGQVRPRRALQVGLVVAAAGLARFGDFLAGLWVGSGPAPAQLWLSILFLGFIALMSIFAFLAWGVSEPVVRRAHSSKLATLEALMRGRWTNATVARATLRGVATGSAGAALVLLIGWGLRPLGVAFFTGDVLGGLTLSRPTAFTAVPGLALVGDYFFWTFPVLLACLCVPTVGLSRRLERAGTVSAVLLACLLIRPPLLPTPVVGTLPALLVMSALPLFLFLRFDLLSALIGHFTLFAMLRLPPLWIVDDLTQQVGAALVLLVGLSPLWVSLPYLRSGREVTYGYDPERDIPADVLQRVTERARHRLELETARGIQASILPDLPDRLAGFEVAHAYLPSSEVGGDARALCDGFLAAVEAFAGGEVDDDRTVLVVRRDPGP